MIPTETALQSLTSNDLSTFGTLGEMGDCDASVTQVSGMSSVGGQGSSNGTRGAKNSMQGGSKGTQATRSLTLARATVWPFDFCDALVFPQIAVVRVHMVAASGFPRAVARPPDGCKVTVETAEPRTPQRTGLRRVDQRSWSVNFSFISANFDFCESGILVCGRKF